MALAQIPSRDQAEHLARVLRDELAKIGGALNNGKERESETKERDFLGNQPFVGFGPGREVIFEGSYHIDGPVLKTAEPPA